MKITGTGKITMPQHIRGQLDLPPGTEVEREVRDGAALLRKASADKPLDGRGLVEWMRGRGSVKTTTDEIMALTRGE
jgi:bifunctional DNA-binding transcriptional regulator/antitoxin component of YhaV-PrlF toxin-antitoxin module